MMSIRSFALLTAVGVLVTSCDGPTAPTPIASIEVTAPTTVMAVGTNLQLTAVVQGNNGAMLAGHPVTWTSANPAIATVSPTGLVASKRVGATTIVASSAGRNGRAAITVEAPTATQVRINLIDSLPYGQSVRASVEVLDQFGQPISSPAVRWSSSDSTTVSVDASGNVRSLYIGIISISATTESVTVSKPLTSYSRWAAVEPVVDVNAEDPRCSLELRFALNDLDASGREDVVLGGWTNCGSDFNPLTPLKILIWDEQDRLIDRTEALLGRKVLAGVNVPVVRDVNGDGRPDIFLAGFADYNPAVESSQLFLNRSSAFTPVDIASPKIWGHGQAVADVNGDGCPDLLQGGGMGGSSVEQYFWFGDCLGQFQGKIISPTDWRGQRALETTLSNGEPATGLSPGGMSVCPADFNGDNVTDILYTDHLIFSNGIRPGQDNVIVEFDWNRPAPVQLHLLPAPLFDRGNTGVQRSHDQRCYVGDLNRDGKPDIIITSTTWPTWDGSAIQVYLNKGNWEFEDVTDRAFPSRLTSTGSGFSGLLRDFNGDGVLDFYFPVESWSGKHESQLWRGVGDGTFTPVSIDWTTMYQTAVEAVRRRFRLQGQTWQPLQIAEPIVLPRRDGALDFLIGIGYDPPASVLWFLARPGLKLSAP